MAPEDFLGGVPCLDAPGAMRRYVATIIDVTPETEADAASIGEFALPSSRPVDCLQSVGSSLVVAGRKYVAEIDGYDRTDIVPLGPGSRAIVDFNGVFVPPRWTTVCGREPAKMVTAVASVMRFVRECQPLNDHAPSDLVGISVRVDPMVAGLQCGNDVGKVAQFSVENLSTGDELSAPCGQPIDFGNLQSSTTYEFAVLGFEAGSTTATWSSFCVGTTVAGTIVSASCDPLRSTASTATPDGDAATAGDAGSP